MLAVIGEICSYFIMCLIQHSGYLSALWHSVYDVFKHFDFTKSFLESQLQTVTHEQIVGRYLSDMD